MTQSEFEKKVAHYNGTFNKYYPDVETNYWGELDNEENGYNLCDHEENRFFWNSEFMSPQKAFAKEVFYIGIFHHPTCGDAVYGNRTNRGYMWRFDSIKNLRQSLSYKLGGIKVVEEMIKDGYLELKECNLQYNY